MGGGFGTRPWWLALLACGSAYWPLVAQSHQPSPLDKDNGCGVISRPQSSRGPPPWPLARRRTPLRSPLLSCSVSHTYSINNFQHLPGPYCTALQMGVAGPRLGGGGRNETLCCRSMTRNGPIDQKAVSARRKHTEMGHPWPACVARAGLHAIHDCGTHRPQRSTRIEQTLPAKRRRRLTVNSGCLGRPVANRFAKR